MSFREYSVDEVQRRLGLRLRDAVLFQQVPTYTVNPEFDERIRYGVDLATSIDTEKAKSEFIIAPVLMELRRATGGRFKLFSGVEWSVDPARGLNGYCDFILTRGGSQLFVSAPFLAIAEAKNDHIINGLGQCIAAMYAATVANQAEGLPPGVVYGIVSTGTLWRFLRLTGDQVEIDTDNVLVSDLPRLMGVLDLITRPPAGP
jgi:hypothetical protein